MAMDEHNICEHLKLQYKLLNVIFELNMEELCWNVHSFWDCLKVCKATIPLMFAVEAQIVAKNCTN